jgi:hypothetical protein
MSETDNQGVQNTQAPSPPAQQQTIPIERFNEVNSVKNSLQEQNQVLQHLLRQAFPQNAPAAQPLPPHMEKLKEENPALFEHLQQLEARDKQKSAALYDLSDKQDRESFERRYGQKVPQQRMQMVEQKLEQLRQQGQFGWTRETVLVHMTGFDTLNAPAAPAAPQAPQQAQAQPRQSFAPSSDPSAAATPATGAAPAGNASETLEQMEARLSNIPL